MTVLIDTCVLIYIATNKSLQPAAKAAMDKARKDSQILVSPVSAWELGLLFFEKQNYRSVFQPDVTRWFTAFMQVKGIAAAPFDADMALDSTCLPGNFHRDPADRFLVATARKLKIPLVTRDRPILDYAAAGHVSAIAC